MDRDRENARKLALSYGKVSNDFLLQTVDDAAIKQLNDYARANPQLKEFISNPRMKVEIAFTINSAMKNYDWWSEFSKKNIQEQIYILVPEVRPARARARSPSPPPPVEPGPEYLRSGTLPPNEQELIIEIEKHQRQLGKALRDAAPRAEIKMHLDYYNFSVAQLRYSLEQRGINPYAVDAPERLELSDLIADEGAGKPRKSRCKKCGLPKRM